MPTNIETAWNFFSSPKNLSAITPTNLGFKIISPDHDKAMYAGQLIEYKVKPLWGITFGWLTEITQVMDRQYFIDEQRSGPYQFWHHQHHFKEIDGGVEMTDIVHYRISLGFIGSMINALVVRKKLEHIFQHRYKKVEEIFGAWHAVQPLKMEAEPR